MSLRLGEHAPDLALPATDGAFYRLAEPGPAATVVYWTCNHCPYAIDWHERMLAVARDYADRGVRVLAVNSNDAERYPADSPEAMADRIDRDGGWPHPYLHDESQEAAREWGAKKTPHVFLLDADLRLRYEGAPDADYDDEAQNADWLRAALDAVLAGRDPERPSTEAVGCSIKWKP